MPPDLPTPHTLGYFSHPSHSSPFPMTSDKDDKGVWSGAPTPTQLQWWLEKLCLEKLWAWDIKRARCLSVLASAVLRRYCFILPIPKEALPSASQSLQDLRQQRLRGMRMRWPRPARTFFQSAVRERRWPNYGLKASVGSRNWHRKNGLEKEEERVREPFEQKELFTGTSSHACKIHSLCP